MRFEFWVKYFKFISLFFVGLSLFWAYSVTFDPFGIYDYFFAKSFWNLEQLPSDVARTKRFILGPLGTTSAGYFTLQYFISTSHQLIRYFMSAFFRYIPFKNKSVAELCTYF